MVCVNGQRLPGPLLEPLSALDAKIRIKLRAEIKQLQVDLGITTIYVTHDQEEALAISDRIVVFRQGQISGVFLNENHDIDQEILLKIAYPKKNKILNKTS